MRKNTAVWLNHNIFYMSVAAVAYLHILQSFDAALRGTALNSQLVETLCVEFKKKKGSGRREGKKKGRQKEKVKQTVTAGAPSPRCTINRSINGY